MKARHKVMDQATASTTEKVFIDTHDLSDGIYSYRFRTADAAGTPRSFVVAH